MRTDTGTANHRHPHDDAPRTAAAFERLAGLPDGPERDALRQDLVRAWLPMSERLAGRFRNRGEALEDLRQVAALGLVKAVDRYDPDRGAAFESYAVPTITGEIKRHFRDHMWTLHVPRRVQDLRGRVRAATQELAANGGAQQPSTVDLAEHTGMTEDEVRAGLEAINSFSALSLDAELPGGDDGYSLSDSLGSADPALDIVVDREAVKPGLRCLPERERKILYMRFFRDMTQSRIAEDLGISQMHVSRLITRCCSRLREEVMGQEALGRAPLRREAMRREALPQREQGREREPGRERELERMRERERGRASRSTEAVGGRADGTSAERSRAKARLRAAAAPRAKGAQGATRPGRSYRARQRMRRGPILSVRRDRTAA
ncbi:SigB/SigF/SigG family RNA polymerase sigma factor [Streptomyces sp. MAG02]|nr:SigB/SigF/SigG family RNA polymerase sigma factor [Streptomyces sp. MAG02]